MRNDRLFRTCEARASSSTTTKENLLWLTFVVELAAMFSQGTIGKPWSACGCDVSSTFAESDECAHWLSLERLLIAMHLTEASHHSAGQLYDGGAEVFVKRRWST